MRLSLYCLCFSLISHVSFASKNIESSLERFDDIKQKIQKLEKDLGDNSHIGVSIYQVENRHQHESKIIMSYRGDERFPLTSTFKTFACAKALLEVQRGNLQLTDSLRMESNKILSYAPIAKDYVGQPFSLAKACEAALTMSDNSAANQVLEQIGGPQSLTKFFTQIGDTTSRLDRIEPELNQAIEGDLRDTTTPNAVTLSLSKIIFGDVLSMNSKQQLIDWMKANQVAFPLIRAVLPQGWQVADRSGAGGFGARSLTAIVWPIDQKPFILSIYIKNTTQNMARRNQVIRDISQAIIIELTTK